MNYYCIIKSFNVSKHQLIGMIIFLYFIVIQSFTFDKWMKWFKTCIVSWRCFSWIACNKFLCQFFIPWRCILYGAEHRNKFKNSFIEETLVTFDVKRILSYKGEACDSVIAETIYKIIKMELAYNKKFENLRELEWELFDYVNVYNNVRIHSSLNYRSPVEYRLLT